MFTWRLIISERCWRQVATKSFINLLWTCAKFLSGTFRTLRVRNVSVWLRTNFWIYLILRSCWEHERSECDHNVVWKKIAQPRKRSWTIKLGDIMKKLQQESLSHCLFRAKRFRLTFCLDVVELDIIKHLWKLFLCPTFYRKFF
jgi:hypothetical protein